MTTNSDLEFGHVLNYVKDASLEQRLGELEVRLGEARLECDRVRVREIQLEISQVQAEGSPPTIPEVKYPLPLDESAYYGLAGEIIKAIEPHSEADPVAMLMNFLTAFGNVIGDGAYFRVGADKHYCKLFCVLVGDTAKGRKGTSWHPIRALFEVFEPEWVADRLQTGLSSGEGLIWHVRDPIYKQVLDKKTGVVNDTLIDGGIGDKRLFVIEGEFAQTLKVLSREGNTLSPVIRNAWDTGNLQLLTKNSPAKATGAHISITAHVTRQELLRGLSEIETGNGFANRFLFFCVRRSKELPFGGAFDSIDLDSMSGKLSQAVVFAKQAGEVKWSEETRPLWEVVYPELSEGRPGNIGAITARAEAQVTRLACIYALLDCSTVIKPSHLKAAMAVWTYCEDSVRYIFQNTVANPLANKVLQALAIQPQGMTRTEINNLLGGNYSTIRITEALNELQCAGLTRCEKIETGGRPVERWFFITKDTEKTE